MIDILPSIEETQCGTRRTKGYNIENRWYVREINVSSFNNFLPKLKANAPRPGRPLEQSTFLPICSRCGMNLGNHDNIFCSFVFKHSQNSEIAR